MPLSWRSLVKHGGTMNQQRTCKFIFLMTLLSFVCHLSAVARASGKGSLQAQIPNIDLSQVDEGIKSQCHTEAVEQSGFDPNSPNNPTTSDFRKQHAEAVATSLVEELVFSHHPSYYKTRQREREGQMRDDLKAYSDRAQNYVKTFRTCLEAKI